MLYSEKFKNTKDVPDMDIPPELCLELLMAADYLNRKYEGICLGVKSDAGTSMTIFRCSATKPCPSAQDVTKSLAVLSRNSNIPMFKTEVSPHGWSEIHGTRRHQV